MRTSSKLIITLLSLTLTTAQAYVVGQSCGQLFDQTGDVIAYIADLSQNQKLSVEQLARLYEALKSEDKFINPYTKQDAIKADVFIHWQKFEELVQDGAIDKKKLGEWLKEKLKEKERVKTERTRAREKTQDSNIKIKFNRIRPGKNINYHFEMMAYPLTQKQWTLLAGENPSHFVNGPHTITIEINGKKIKMQPDNPVESINWRDIQRYIKRLNELSKKGDPLIYQIIPDHVKGAKYRLPTEPEWEHVARNEGQEVGAYSVDPKKLLDYGWFAENSGETTHPVGEKIPLIVNGYEFELFGNVAEWVLAYDPDNSLGLNRILRGSGWDNGSHSARISACCAVPSKNRSFAVGFRLVRILP